MQMMVVAIAAETALIWRVSLSTGIFWLIAFVPLSVYSVAFHSVAWRVYLRVSYFVLKFLRVLVGVVTSTRGEVPMKLGASLGVERRGLEEWSVLSCCCWCCVADHAEKLIGVRTSSTQVLTISNLLHTIQ